MSREALKTSGDAGDAGDAGDSLNALEAGDAMRSSVDEMFHLDISRRTRGHSLKMIKYRCNKDVKKYFFSFRVISKWNMLDDTTVTVNTVNSFKT